MTNPIRTIEEIKKSVLESLECTKDCGEKSTHFHWEDLEKLVEFKLKASREEAIASMNGKLDKISKAIIDRGEIFEKESLVKFINSIRENNPRI